MMRAIRPGKQSAVFHGLEVIFSVNDGSFPAQEMKIGATWRSQIIDLQGKTVDISFRLKSQGGLDNGQDFVRVSAMVDGARTATYLSNW